MNKIQFDKKQLPQIIVLGVLSLCLFGYAALTMLAPPATNAAKPPQPAAQGSAQAGASNASSRPVAFELTDEAPSAKTRDPFVSTAPIAPPTPVATPPAATSPKIGNLPTLEGVTPFSLPKAPPLPAAKNVAAIAAKPDPGPPTWTFTGVIGNDDDPSSLVAVLRKDDEHRYVHVGETLEPDLKVVSIQPGLVVLKSGGHRFAVKLGSSEKPALTPAVEPSAPSTPVPAAPAERQTPAVHPPGNTEQAPTV